MLSSVADLRPSRLDVLAPPAGPVTVTMVTGPVDELPDGVTPPGEWTGGAAWVQRVGAGGSVAAMLLVGQVTPGAEATTIVFDDVAAPLPGDPDGPPALDLGGTYQIVVAVGGGMMAGSFIRSKETTTSPNIEVPLQLRTPEVLLPVTLLVAPGLPGGGSGPELASEVPLGPVEGGAVGVSERAAREDHRHPRGEGAEADERHVAIHLPVAIEFLEGQWDNEDVNLGTFPNAAESPVGTLFLLTEQVPGYNDVWRHAGDGALSRVSPSWLGPDRDGTLLTVAWSPLVGYPQGDPRGMELLRVVDGGVEALVVTEEITHARWLVAVSATDGSATEFQPVTRSDDSPAAPPVPQHWRASGDPISVASATGEIVVVPFADGSNPRGGIYRIAPPGEPWEMVDPGVSAPVLVRVASDVGFPGWWTNTFEGPVATHVSAHDVRVQHDLTENHPDTLRPWFDQNEVNAVLARAIEWSTIGVDEDFSWPTGLGQPSIWFGVNASTGAPVTGTLPPKAEFPRGRSVRCSNNSEHPVTIVDADSSDTIATIEQGEAVEITLDSSGTVWLRFGR